MQGLEPRTLGLEVTVESLGFEGLGLSPGFGRRVQGSGFGV